MNEEQEKIINLLKSGIPTNVLVAEQIAPNVFGKPFKEIIVDFLNLIYKDDWGVWPEPYDVDKLFNTLGRTFDWFEKLELKTWEAYNIKRFKKSLETKVKDWLTEKLGDYVHPMYEVWLDKFNCSCGKIRQSPFRRRKTANHKYNFIKPRVLMECTAVFSYEIGKKRLPTSVYYTITEGSDNLKKSIQYLDSFSFGVPDRIGTIQDIVVKMAEKY